MIRRLIGVKVITEHGQLLGNISNVYLCVDTEHSIAIEFQLVKPFVARRRLFYEGSCDWKHELAANDS